MMPAETEFQKLVAGRQDVDLVALMFEFAHDAYPHTDFTSSLAELKRLGELAADRVVDLPGLPGGLHGRLTEISRLLYQSEGFHGNEETYYDPRNSYLNEVLARRCGIPITLSILYIAVAQRAGVEMYGVATPGHFVVGCGTGERSLYVDAFAGGDVLPRDACRHRIERMTGQLGSVEDSHFRPATTLEIAARVLRNLKAAYAMQDEWEAVLPVQERLRLLLPQMADEGRDLGLIYLRLGRPQEALQLLEAYRRDCSEEQAASIDPYLRSARRMVVEWN